MKKLIGNVDALVLDKNTVKNKIGENEVSFNEVSVIKGFLDLVQGDSKYSSYNAKIQESTHLFLCDYTNNITTENKLKIKGNFYDILLVDNVMDLDKHLEIYLKFVGVKREY